jgi:DNA-binding PadR family transcriptional regulator
MSLRHAILGGLADCPRTGYELTKHFGQSLAYAWPASHSQIYPELRSLVAAGLIVQTGSGPRGAKRYAVTDEGLEELRRWLLQTEPDRRVRSEAALRLFLLWLLEPADARVKLAAELAHWKGILAELEEIAREPVGTTRKERTFRLSLDLGITSTRARVEQLEHALASGALEG